MDFENRRAAPDEKIQSRYPAGTGGIWRGAERKTINVDDSFLTSTAIRCVRGRAGCGRKTFGQKE